MSDSLPFATELDRPIAGRIKERPEDFEVEELPAYEPCGEGEHLYLFIEKIGLDTKTASDRIARAIGAAPRDAGWAGLKDRHAVTRQWLSFARADAPPDLALDGIRVLRAARHRNKLRTGHLHGNRFRVLLRGAQAERADDARALLDALARHGAPAYYGEQRFGRDGGNAHAARAWLVDGGPAPRDRFRRKLLVSSLQSELFNRLLAARVSAGELASIVEGDLCRKEDSGGLFVATDLATERARAAAFEVSATGPMFGASMRWPEGEARAREEAALAAAGLDLAALERWRKHGEGTRRPYRFRVQGASVEVEPEGLRIAFTLPAGAYATVVLRELTRE